MTVVIHIPLNADIAKFPGTLLQVLDISAYFREFLLRALAKTGQYSGDFLDHYRAHQGGHLLAPHLPKRPSNK
jgi:hypothetical protein